MSYNKTVMVTATSSHYWIIYSNDEPEKNFKLWYVVADDYRDEYEMEEIQLIDRGRRTEYGTRYGYKGTLQIQVRDDEVIGVTARQQKKRFEEMKAERRPVYLKNPFGDVFLITTGDLDIGRVGGVGTREIVDISLPYTEVAE